MSLRINGELELPPWTETETAYIAGIIDGEGCIGVYHKAKRGYFIQLSIVNTNLALVEWLEERLDTNKVETLRDNRARNKLCHRITTDRMRAKGIIERVLPYLIAKKPQAELALKFKAWQDGLKVSETGHRPYTEEDLKVCDHYVEASHELNRRGPP